MAYDEKLAKQFRNAIGKKHDIDEKRMMGGACFMVNGHMVGGADRQKDGSGRFMFRVGKENEAEALARPGAIPLEQGGRRMSGMVFVDESACDARALKSWVKLALSFTQSLPPKKK